MFPKDFKEQVINKQQQVTEDIRQRFRDEIIQNFMNGKYRWLSKWHDAHFAVLEELVELLPEIQIDIFETFQGASDIRNHIYYGTAKSRSENNGKLPKPCNLYRDREILYDFVFPV